MDQPMANFCKKKKEHRFLFSLRLFIRLNDRIINVNGHPVVRSMEYTALKLIRESTDFVHLVNFEERENENKSDLFLF